MSLGAVGQSGVVTQALRYAASHRAILIAASGNRVSGQPATLQLLFPANQPEAFAV